MSGNVRFRSEADIGQRYRFDRLQRDRLALGLVGAAVIFSSLGPRGH